MLSADFFQTQLIFFEKIPLEYMMFKDELICAAVLQCCVQHSLTISQGRKAAAMTKTKFLTCSTSL